MHGGRKCTNIVLCSDQQKKVRFTYENRINRRFHLIDSGSATQTCKAQSMRCSIQPICQTTIWRYQLWKMPESRFWRLASWQRSKENKEWYRQSARTDMLVCATGMNTGPAIRTIMMNLKMLFGQWWVKSSALQWSERCYCETWYKLSGFALWAGIAECPSKAV